MNQSHIMINGQHIRIMNQSDTNGAQNVTIVDLKTKRDEATGQSTDQTDGSTLSILSDANAKVLDTPRENGDAIQSASGGSVVLNGSIFNICSIAAEQADIKNTDIKAELDPSTTASLMDSSMFVDSKGLIFSVAEDVSDLGLDSRGLEVATSTIPSQLLQHDPATTTDANVATSSFIQILTESGEIMNLSSDTLKEDGLHQIVATSDGTFSIVRASAVPAPGGAVQTAGKAPQAAARPQEEQNNLKRKGGWPKGRRRKEPKQSTVPKPPSTGYVLFAAKNRLRVKQENPSATFSEITRQLGAEWSGLPMDEKQVYLKLAEEDKKRYKEEVKAYKESEQANIKKSKSTPNGLSCADLDGSEVDVDSDILYCKVCDQYFSSLHNRKEHMYGKTHLNKVSTAIEQLTKAPSPEPPPPPPPAPPAVSAPAAAATGEVVVVEPAAPPQPSPPVSLDSLMLTVMEKNQEREMEVQHLQQSVNLMESVNVSLVNTIKELEELQNKYLQDLATAKAYGAALATQIDTLRMVPTLFGVINF